MSRSLCLLALVALPSLSAADEKAGRPNVLFVSPTTTRRTPSAPTARRSTRHPNIDRLAKEGMLFRNCFCTNAILRPQPGRDPHGQAQPPSTASSTTAWRSTASNSTSASCWASRGIRQALIGKWHLKRQWHAEGLKVISTHELLLCIHRMLWISWSSFNGKTPVGRTSGERQVGDESSRTDSRYPALIPLLHLLQVV